MKRINLMAGLGLAVFLSTGVLAYGQNKTSDNSMVVEATFKGTIHVGKSTSYILNVGEETGDFAAFCFAKRSAVGRSIMANCKNGQVCRIVGKVDQGAACKVDSKTRSVLSGTGRMLSVRSARPVTQTRHHKRKSHA